MISKSSKKDYYNKRAEIPEPIEFYEKEWFLLKKNKDLQKRKIIDLED